VGLSHKEVAGLVELVLKEITDCLCRGENVKLSSFGSFIVREKSQRIGRNPKTGEEVTVPSHRVVVFRSSDVFKNSINSNARAARAADASGGSDLGGCS
jgi:integration host factor subunit alpha